MTNILQIDNEDYVLTFADEFNGSSTRYWKGFNKNGVWATSFSPHEDDTRWIAANNELQYYTDPDNGVIASPFTVGGGVMEINASELTATEQALADGQAYSSGLLTTEMTFAASSGYIEIRADIPDEQGFWSALWLLPADGDWSAEIDIAEVLGSNTDAVHTNVWSNGTPDEDIIATEVGDGFHTYGLLWTPTTIEWQIDGLTVRTSPNTVTEEMFLAIGLAVGGWDGGPDATTDFSDGLKIDYVRVYELESDPNRNDAIPVGEEFQPDELHDGTSGNDTLNGSRWSDAMFGKEGNDFLYGKKGDDWLSGGDGKDELFGHNDNDTLLGDAGDDKLIGGKGEDRLEGGTGTDHLWGGTYNGDTVTDTFVFNDGDGKDFVHKFDADDDLIDLTSFTTDWASMQNVIIDVGWATKLEFGHIGGNWSDMVYLIGLDTAELTSANFIFDEALA